MLLNTYVKLRNKLRSKKGQGFVEYIILIVLVALGLMVTLIAFRGQIADAFTRITDNISNMQIPN